MNIAFDASDICAGKADGTTRYTRELMKRLPELAPDDVWEFYGPCEAPIPSPAREREGVRAVAPSQTPSSSPSYEGEKSNATWRSIPSPFAWTQTRFMLELLKKTPDVLFMPIQQLPILRWPKMKTVAVIHDLAFHEYPEQFGYKQWALLHIFSAQVAKEADAIIAVSEATKQDIKKYYGRTKNVHVIHHGIDHTRFRVFSDQEKQVGFKKLQEKYPDIKNNYLLFVGQIQPRKNIVKLIEAFEMLGSDFLPSYEGRRGGVIHAVTTPSRSPSYEVEKTPTQLVIAGGHGWNNKEIYDRIESSPRRKDILVTGAVPDELLPSLYANASVFVLPSLQEGFGIPVIEAAACGVPVVTSNCSSTKEIMEGAGILIDPLSAESIANGMQEALSNHDAIAEACIARAQQFSWDKTAQETMSILKGVITL
ncbi:MAG: glycosyltransferase family 1 protein [Candidatus Andersenbacteria bacterium]